METTVVKRYSLSKQVADKLENMIVSGQFKVGEKINSETELMAMFNVSRNTLREAIHALTSAGVLEVKQGDGTYVRNSNRFTANMKREYEKVSAEDIWEVRNALEATIVNLAAKKRTEKDLKKIETALNELKSVKEFEKNKPDSDVKFHLYIAEACHNKILIDLYLSILDYLENFIEERQTETNLDFEKIYILHEKLFEAIRDGNCSAAELCVRNILNI